VATDRRQPVLDKPPICPQMERVTERRGPCDRWWRVVPPGEHECHALALAGLPTRMASGRSWVQNDLLWKQNTATKRLTVEMLDRIFWTARELLNH
jgi:hypothetical protein